MSKLSQRIADNARNDASVAIQTQIFALYGETSESVTYVQSFFAQLNATDNSNEMNEIVKAALNVQ